MMKIEKRNEILIFHFCDDFDEYQVSKMKDECILSIQFNQPEKVILDFKNVDFVDSTGIGFILARYKQCRNNQCILTLANLKTAHRTILGMSGLFQLIEEEVLE